MTVTASGSTGTTRAASLVGEEVNGDLGDPA